MKVLVPVSLIGPNQCGNHGLEGTVTSFHRVSLRMVRRGCDVLDSVVVERLLHHLIVKLFAVIREEIIRGFPPKQDQFFERPRYGLSICGSQRLKFNPSCEQVLEHE